MWATWPTDGPLKKRQMGHRKAMSALAKMGFDTKCRKIGPEMQKGIRGGVTPACAGVVGTADSPGPYDR